MNIPSCLLWALLAATLGLLVILPDRVFYTRSRRRNAIMTLLILSCLVGAYLGSAIGIVCLSVVFLINYSWPNLKDFLHCR
jgi:RsiW-degrading membrane proteinase PrsW (M82 family)